MSAFLWGKPELWFDRVAQQEGAGRTLWFSLQCLFEISHAVIRGMTVQVSGPIWSALFTAKPLLRRFLQRSQDILVNLPVPG